MAAQTSIATASVAGHSLQIDIVSDDDKGWMVFEVAARDFGADDLVLHWAVGRQSASEWLVPLDEQARTSPAAQRVPGAMQTPFPPEASGHRKIRVEINSSAGLKGFQFVLHRKPNDWLKCGKDNFVVDFDSVRRSGVFRESVKEACEASPSAQLSLWRCSGIDVAVLGQRGASGACEVQVLVDSTKDLVVQYGLAAGDRRWRSSTRAALEATAGGSLKRGALTLPRRQSADARFLMFVLHDPSANQWLKDGKQDFAFELPPFSGDGTELDDEPEVVPVAQGVHGADAEKFEPQPRAMQRSESKRFKSVVEKARQEEPDAKVTSWVVPGTEIEVAILATALETELNVHVLVHSDCDLVLQYGPASETREWKSSKRVSLNRVDKGQSEGTFNLPAGEVDKFLMFVLHDGSVNRWLKDGNRDFELEVPRHLEWDRLKKEAEKAAAAEAAVAAKHRESFLKGRPGRQAKADVSFDTFDLERDCGHLDVACAAADGGASADVQVRAWLNPRLGETMLHFGVLAKPQSGQWSCPEDFKGVKWPAGITKVDGRACQVPLQKMDEQLWGLDFSVQANMGKDGGKDVCVPVIGGIAFVMKTVSGSEWFKPSDGGDAMVRFSSQGRWKGEWADVADKIVKLETMSNHMSLNKRYCDCMEIVNNWEKQTGGHHMRRLASWSTLMHVDSREAVWSRMPSMPLCEIPEEEVIKSSKEGFWSWIFVWQRFSFQQLLTWEKNTCTQPRILASTTNAITSRMSELWKAHPRCRMWIRWTLATMGAGGSAGQKIRDDILVIMHAHNIKEIHGTYYEQWHQKLHNNTTPADIGICRAIIAFLKSNGNMAEYWRVLADHGITKEHLHSYSRQITTEPYMVQTDVGRLIGDFERYLETLRSVHDALDLQLALDRSRWCMDSGLQAKVQAVADMGGTGYKNLDEGHGKLMSIARAREDILAILNKRDTDPSVIRQLLVIDYTLETQQGVLVQGMADEKRLGNLCEQLKVLLTSLVGHMPTEDELQALLADWTQLSPACAQQSWNSVTQSALLLKAMTDRIGRIIGELSDHYQTFMGPKAAFLGEAIDAPKHAIDVFVDEVLRGTALMAISLVLQRMEPVLRELAHLPPWQMISTVAKPIQGELKVIDKMLHMQDKVFDTPTVLLSGAVSGEEEVPDGVVGVLVRSAKEAPDILSHCAVRARNFGVLLATCFDPAISAGLAADFEGKWVEVTCKPDGSLSVRAAERPAADGQADAAKAAEADRRAAEATKVKMNLTDTLGCKWTVRPDEMNSTNVGSKSGNLALLRPRLPKDILTPQAVALPYGSMQKALTDPANKDAVLPKLTQVLGKLQPSTRNEDAQAIFEEAQALVAAMKFPPSLKEALLSQMAEVGKQDGEARLTKLFQAGDAWDAIKGVWASLFAIRPWVSLAKAGRSFHDLNMAVLVQELVEARYAFVLHTVNPFTHDKDELYGELVAGRGETLVGNYPGRALSFAMKRGEEPRVLSFPSKSVALHTQATLIFRSDSNGEDLEGFAGAGLFESVCAEEDKGGFQRLHRLPIITDAAYRQKLLKRIAEVGWTTEKAFGGAPQDIEGCVDVGERIYIVQSRPQV